jgi:RNA polymerase sigma-70 factor (ECF subfamily)
MTVPSCGLGQNTSGNDGTCRVDYDDATIDTSLQRPSSTFFGNARSASISYGGETMLATTTAEPSDETIVERILEGDTSAFEILMRRHNRRVYRAARSIVKSDDEAEDTVQETYVSAFKHLASFQGRARFATWLVRIAVYEALARARREGRQASLDDIEDPMATTRNPEDAINDSELRVLLEEAIDALPVAFRTVFVLRAVEEMSGADTAESLGIPEETVRTRLHRARGLLREHLASKLESAAPKAYDFHLVRCDRIVAAVFARIRPS